ncbi:MAG: hypothetical protein ACI9OJ_000797, partial [Myxococcota bacterium]
SMSCPNPWFASFVLALGVVWPVVALSDVPATLSSTRTVTCPSKAQVIVSRHRVGSGPIVVVRPAEGGPFPVVYALAGLGEMVRGPKASAAGWVERYGLVQAMCAVSSPALSTADFGGLVQGKQLYSYQQRLKAGFGGLVIVSPGAPRKMGARFRKHLFDEVIPWAESSLPVKAGTAFRGIDGISLGGRHALRLGFSRPDQFRSLGTEQASVKGLWSFVRKAVRDAKPAVQGPVINLLSSHRDGYRHQIKRFAGRLRGLGLMVRHYETPGAHNKRFAKGPGAIDMLLFHDSVLNQKAGLPGAPW